MGQWEIYHDENSEKAGLRGIKPFSDIGTHRGLRFACSYPRQTVEIIRPTNPRPGMHRYFFQPTTHIPMSPLDNIPLQMV